MLRCMHTAHLETGCRCGCITAPFAAQHHVGRVTLTVSRQPFTTTAWSFPSHLVSRYRSSKESCCTDVHGDDITARSHGISSAGRPQVQH